MATLLKRGGKASICSSYCKKWEALPGFSTHLPWSNPLIGSSSCCSNSTNNAIEIMSLL